MRRTALFLTLLSVALAGAGKFPHPLYEGSFVASSDAAPALDRFRLVRAENGRPELELFRGREVCRYAIDIWDERSLGVARTVDFDASREKDCGMHPAAKVFGYLNLDRPDQPGFIRLVDGETRVNFVVSSVVAP